VSRENKAFLRDHSFVATRSRGAAVGGNIYYVYVLENLIDFSWYIGFTTNVSRRVSEHNRKIGGDYTSKKAGGWRLIYFEAYLNKSDALGRECFLKSGSGRKFVKKQLQHFFED
jgi:putative endonuclease